MLRRLLIIVPLFALAGCFDFDSAYQAYCDAGHCTAATGGGGEATGGGMATGGGVATGGGSETGGGAATGGGVATGGGGSEVDGGSDGGVDGGQPDAGCTSTLCPALTWFSTQTSLIDYAVAPGLNVDSLARFNLYASFDVPFGTGTRATHYEYKFIDGTPTVVPRTDTGDFSFTGGQSARSLSGISTNDQWFSWTIGVKHFVGNTGDSAISECTYGAGTYGHTFATVYPESATDAWLIGGRMTMCHWQQNGGVVQTADPVGRENIYLLNGYRTDAGELYMVGGDYNSSASSGKCVIYLGEAGVLQSAPIIVDTHFGDGCSDIGGVGSSVYVLARDDGNSHGVILSRIEDGGFDFAYTAPFTLKAMDVLPTGEVWAIGAAPDQAVYFDGGTWDVVNLPGADTRFTAVWENVKGTPEGVLFSGHETTVDATFTALVLGYRTLGK